MTKYSKNSMPVLRVDAHFTVVESALKGYVKWRSSPHQSSTDEVWPPPLRLLSLLPPWLISENSNRNGLPSKQILKDGVTAS